MNLNPFNRKKKSGQIRYISTTRFSNAAAASSKDIEKKLDKLIAETNTPPSKPPHNPEKLRDESRKMIALTFVFTFVGIVGIVLLFVPIYNAIVFSDVKEIPQVATYQPLDIEKVLTTVGTILGTPLGFVVGYYFKEEHNLRSRHNKTENK